MKQKNELIMNGKTLETTCSQIFDDDKKNEQRNEQRNDQKNNKTDCQVVNNTVHSILFDSHIKRSKERRRTVTTQKNKSNLERKTHKEKHFSEKELSKHEEKKRYYHTSLQGTWREIREQTKQYQTSKNFESRKDDFMAVVASVQQQLENIDQNRSHDHRQKKDQRENKDQIKNDTLTKKRTSPNNSHALKICGMNEQKFFLEELNAVQRIMNFLFDHNADLLGLLLYKTKHGQVRSRIGRLSFYYSWFCYAKNPAENQTQNDMTRWFFSGIVDAHILALSNNEHPNTTKYKEMIIDVALRERRIFDHRLYPIPKVYRTMLDGFEFPENWSVLQFPATQFLYQAIMGYNHSYHHGWSKPVEMLNVEDVFLFCNRLSEQKGYKPVYTKLSSVEKKQGMTDLDFNIAVALSQKDNSSKWMIDWSADGYRLPDTHERLLLQYIKNHQLRHNHKCKRIGWYKNNSYKSTSQKGSLEKIDLDQFNVYKCKVDEERFFDGCGSLNSNITECGNHDGFHIYTPSEHQPRRVSRENLIRILGDEKYEGFEHHETKLLGQRKSDVFDLFDTFGNTSELTVNYCVDEQSVFFGNFLQNNQDKENQNTKHLGSIEKSNCVVDVYQADTFVEMGEHYMSCVSEIYDNFYCVGNYQWSKPYLEYIQEQMENTYRLCDFVDRLGRGIPKNEGFTSPFLGMRLVRGSCIRYVNKEQMIDKDRAKITHIFCENTVLSAQKYGNVLQHCMFPNSSEYTEENLQMSLPFTANEDMNIHRYIRNSKTRTSKDLSQEDKKYVQEQIELFSSDSSDRTHSDGTHRIGQRSNWNPFRSNN